MITVRAIDHVVFRVRDLDAMLRFYTEVIGAEKEVYKEAIGLYQLRVGDALIDLVTVDGELGAKGGPAPGREGHNVDHVCLRALPWNEDAIRKHLGAHGIDNVEIVSRYGAQGEGPSIYIEDPGGNTIELKGPPHERK
ncbi:MAG: VOC family protein [Pseudomonadota bacterium]